VAGLSNNNKTNGTSQQHTQKEGHIQTDDSSRLVAARAC
jgi:hypothetical protein